MTLIVNVKFSCGAHVARVLKWGLTASSTNSPETAVRAAVGKFCARTGRDIEQATFNRVTFGPSAETWTVAWKEAA